MNPRRCPALLVSAPASGQGKTTVTAALARHYRNQGLRVRLFKTGPDFIDPMVLERASGEPVYQLDLWMGGEEHCRELLFDAAASADLILVEGVMGLFDGTPSSADLASHLRIPVLAVIDASAMAQTFGAVAFGLARLRRDVTVAGVFANRVAGEYHAALLASHLPQDLPLTGWLPRDAEVTLPHRHLGLVQAEEVVDLDARLARAATSLHWHHGPWEPAVFATASPVAPQRLLAGVRLAIARDAAFAFLYRANLDLLRALGAELRFFSPLADARLPEADALYLPGGYPELHLSVLGNNHSMRDAIRAHHQRGKPIVAECGGMLYLLDSLTHVDGEHSPMLGLIPGHARMQERLAALALQRIVLSEGELRGHTFHHSLSEIKVSPIAHGVCPNGSNTVEAVYRIGRVTASYIHFYFPSNARVAAEWFAP